MFIIRRNRQTHSRLNAYRRVAHPFNKPSHEKWWFIAFFFHLVADDLFNFEMNNIFFLKFYFDPVALKAHFPVSHARTWESEKKPNWNWLRAKISNATMWCWRNEEMHHDSMLAVVAVANAQNSNYFRVKIMEKKHSRMAPPKPNEVGRMGDLAQPMLWHRINCEQGERARVSWVWKERNHLKTFKS